MSHDLTTSAVPGLNMTRLNALLQSETAQFHAMRPRSAALLARAAKVMPDGAGMGIATGGTLYGNPLSTAAALAMLDEVQTEAAYARIEALGARLADGINAAIARHRLPWRAFRYGPRSGFCLAPNWPRGVEEATTSIHRPFTAARRVFLANRGIWDAIYSAGPQVGFSHDAADIDRYLAVASDFLDQVT